MAANTTSSSASSSFVDPSMVLADFSYSSLDDFDSLSFFDLGGEFDLDSAVWMTKSAAQPTPSAIPSATSADPFAAFEPFFEALHDGAPAFGELFYELVDFELSSDAMFSEPSTSVDLAFSTIKSDPVDGSASPVAVDTRLERAPAAPSTQIEIGGKKRSSSTCKTSSQRQKEEIALLRDSSARLEEELAQLKAKCRQASSDGNATESSSSTCQSSLWEGFAKRQRDARQQAEHENAELRRELRTTMRAAKSLERSLHKRQRMCV